MKTLAWQEYERGVDYKTRIGLYNTVDINERFFSGDQWAGIPHEGLPTPVVNFIRYASAWKIAAVTDRRLKMSFFAEGVSDGGEISIYARQVSAYCDMLWERLKMDYLTKEGLKQAAITGDYVQYFYWDPEIKTGQALTGDINTSLIDNVNYYPGNPNSPDVQSQPYIIIAFRELLSKVKDEAKRNGCENTDEITYDEDNEYTSGDRGKIELDDAGKCNVLLKMYKKNGKVWFEKSVRNAVIQPGKDSGLTRYPIAMMNWDTRKNCCHGTAEVTGLIPNQVFVNKILALAQLGQVQTSFPKVIYDRTRIREWTNRVAGAIAVNGDIGGAAQYLNPPVSSYDAWRGLDTTLQTTMRMMGANDVTLGNIRNPDNTSAFIATRDAAMVPLQSQQERFYSFIEDIGQIWLDFIKSFYRAGRMIPVVDGGKRIFVPIPEGELDKFTMNLRIDVGPSSMWSEIQVLQTLDNLLRGGKISFKQYLERMPDGHIPMKDELMADVQRQEEGEEAGTDERGQPGGGQGAEKIVQVVKALAQSGKVPPELAEGVIKLAQQDADDGAILEALKGAAEQGQIPMEAFQVIVSAIQGGAGGQPQPAPEQPRQPQPKQPEEPQQPQAGAQTPQQDTVKIVEIVQALAQSGKIPGEIAEGVMKLAQQGADAASIVNAIKQAADQGQIPTEALQAIVSALQGATQGQQRSLRPDTAGQQRKSGVAAVIVKAVQALAEAGKIPAQVADAVIDLSVQGADASSMIEALKDSVDKGQMTVEALREVAAALQQAQGQSSAKTTPEQTEATAQSSKPPIKPGETSGVIETVEMLRQAGMIPSDIADSITELIKKGDLTSAAQAIRSALEQGRMTEDAARQIVLALGGQPDTKDIPGTPQRVSDRQNK